MFKQLVELIKIELTSKPRHNKLKVLSEDLVQPQQLSNQELRKYNVKPDFNETEYFEQLEKDDEIDLEDFFDNVDGYNYYNYRNSIDHIALKLDRGDAILSISALKLLEYINMSDGDNKTAVICAENDCLAVIATSWAGGCATSNLLIDFRTDTPIINTIELDYELCVDALTVLPDGTIVVRDWGGEIGVINTDNFLVEDFEDAKDFEIAKDAFASIPSIVNWW